MGNEHYFSAEPAAEKKLKQVHFLVGGQVLTAQASTGTFSSAGLDRGTKVLLSLSRQFPKSEEVLDLGCGWGPIALSIAALSPATEVWAIDVNNRSVELTEKNAGALGLTNLRAVLPQALPRDLRFQEIWSNPPVRIGKAQLHQLLTNYLGLLRPGGRAMLVVQKQLGAESLLRWLNEHSSGYSARKILAERGYWVVEVMSPTGR